mmetsp:Transcript_199/g.389  ORF Transcript_199/g.389 Transcript_199/m.389 type:complete len:247 (+) Transcript_199:129-869(+)
MNLPPSYQAAVGSRQQESPTKNSLAGKDHLMMETVRLHKNIKERQQYDRMAEFYAIIKTTEHLENARLSNSIDKEEYARECSSLISQFKDTESVLQRQNIIQDSRTFMSEYGLGDCALAMERLLTYGVPATVVHRSGDSNPDLAAQARQAAETTQCFITAMDALKLEQKAVDEVQPLISDLMDRLTRMPGLPVNFEPTTKIEQWLIELNQMRAADELSDDQVRQLLHDLDSSYSGFFRLLEQERAK